MSQSTTQGGVAVCRLLRISPSTRGEIVPIIDAPQPVLRSPIPATAANKIDITSETNAPAPATPDVMAARALAPITAVTMTRARA